MASLNIVSYNVRGIRNQIKRRKVIRYLHERKYDIVFIQESHCTNADQKMWENEWGGKAFFSHGSSEAKGVGIWIKKNSPIQITECKKDIEGHFIILDISYEGHGYTLVNVYAPNSDSPDYFKGVFQHMEQVQNDYKIIGGDFNLALKEQDLRGAANGIHAHRDSIQFLEQYMLNEDLVDIWRDQHGDEQRYTYNRDRPQKYFARLDFFLVSKSLVPFVESSINTQYISDHSMPVIKLKPNLIQRGRGYWKLNVQLLENKEYVESVKAIIDEVVNENYEDIKLTWEMIKMKVRGHSIQFASALKKASLKEYKNLENKLHKAEMEKTKNPDEPSKWQEVAEIRAQLNDLDEKKTREAMFRTKKNWFQHGEKNSAYFFALEKRNYNRKCISELRLNNGVITKDFKTILSEQKRFYQMLYENKDRDEDNEFIFEYLNTIQNGYISKITREDRFLLEQEVTIHEIFDSVMTLKQNKCPGIDGLPVEFYKIFWTQIKEVLLELYTRIFSDTLFHRSARRSVISLLDKSNKDLLDLENWRPISLLNTDYKIWDKIIANRLTKVLPYIIEAYQTGFMKGRNISENLSKLLSVIEHCDKNDTDHILISYDCYKAFDSVSFKSLYQIMEFFNFGPNFIRMVRILHTDTTTYVSNNNHWTEEIKFGRGLRQGGNSSPYLYLLVSQILGSHVMQNREIEGVDMGNFIVKLSQYADDLWTPMRNKQASLDAMFRELSDFERAVGIRINYDKTEILRLGFLKESEAKLTSTKPLKWTNDEIKILGITACNTVHKTSERSYQKSMNKISGILESWSHRSLTTLGKVLLCNTLVSSILVYKMMALGRPSEKFFKEYKKKVTTFIWNGKPPRVKYSKLIQDHQYGGLKLVDLEQKFNSLKTIWVRKIISGGPQSEWAKLIYGLLPIKNENIWRCNLSAKDIAKLFGRSLWMDTWSAWSTFNHRDPRSAPEVLDQIICLNSFIKSNRKILQIPELWDLNVKYIRDIFDETQNRFLTYQEFNRLTGNRNQINIITFNRIIKAIPREWKNMILRDFDPEDFESYKNNVEILTLPLC